MTSHLVVYELPGRQQPAPSCIAWRNQGRWGSRNVSFFCWKANLFFSFFVVLLCLGLLFGEVRGVAGEVRLIFDLMAPFLLGCSPGKTFSPFGTQCFSWQRLCKQECCGRSWLCLTCVWHFSTNSAEQLDSGKHLSTCFLLLTIPLFPECGKT